MKNRFVRSVAATAVVSLFGAGYSAGVVAEESESIEFRLVHTAGVECLKKARGYVRVRNRGPVEIMDMSVKGLPPNTEFDVFVIQTPEFPFGLSWYQGDLETNAYGKGYATFIGRFNEETFIVAPGETSAPFVHDEAFPDATSNPATGPVHTFHIGIWFNSPDDAAAAGCPARVTPFNGEHNAGIQILNTSNFPAEQGPLFELKP